MTAATVNGTGAMSREDTTMPRVRCGRDTGRSSIRDPGWTTTTTTIKRDTMTLGRSRCSHPPRYTTISNKHKTEKAFSTKCIGPGGNQCYIDKFQIRGLPIILGQGERAGLRLTKMNNRKWWQRSSWKSAEGPSPAWIQRKANEEKLHFWQSTEYYHVLICTVMDLKSERSQGQ